MERIGIYGGTFNPPHIGHIQAAKQAVERMGLSALLMIPDRIAPHKVLPPNSPTSQQRLEMVRLAASDCPGIEVSDMELRREGVSYTWETVDTLRTQYPDAELVLFMGTDMFLSFHTWKNLFWKTPLWPYSAGEKRAKLRILRRRRPSWKAGVQRWNWCTTMCCLFPPPSFAGCWPSNAPMISCPPG